MLKYAYILHHILASVLQLQNPDLQRLCYTELRTPWKLRDDLSSAQTTRGLGIANIWLLKWHMKVALMCEKTWYKITLRNLHLY